MSRHEFKVVSKVVNKYERDVINKRKNAREIFTGPRVGDFITNGGASIEGNTNNPANILGRIGQVIVYKDSKDSKSITLSHGGSFYLGDSGRVLCISGNGIRKINYDKLKLVKYILEQTRMGTFWIFENDDNNQDPFCEVEKEYNADRDKGRRNVKSKLKPQIVRLILPCRVFEVLK